jgi:hypothetical protein
MDEGNRLGADRTYASNEYNNAYNRDYGMWSDMGNILNNNRTYSSNEYNNAYNRDYAEHTTTEGYKYQDVADANAFAQWEAGQSLAERQFAFQKDQANKSTPITLTAEEYNDVLVNAGEYAGKGKNALANYLNGLVSRGLSEDEAAAIYEQYFPTTFPNKLPDNAPVKYRYFEDTIN